MHKTLPGYDKALLQSSRTFTTGPQDMLFSAAVRSLTILLPVLQAASLAFPLSVAAFLSKKAQD